jgi:hypothetical protein
MDVVVCGPSITKKPQVGRVPVWTPVTKVLEGMFDENAGADEAPA